MEDPTKATAPLSPTLLSGPLEQLLEHLWSMGHRFGAGEVRDPDLYFSDAREQVKKSAARAMAPYIIQAVKRSVNE